MTDLEEKIKGPRIFLARDTRVYKIQEIDRDMVFYNQKNNNTKPISLELSSGLYIQNGGWPSIPINMVEGIYNSDNLPLIFGR